MSDDSGASSDVAPHEAAEAAAASHEVKIRGRGRGREGVPRHQFQKRGGSRNSSPLPVKSCQMK